MKLRFGKRTLTFLIIPDANRKVVRFRVSSLLLYLLPIVALSVVCITLAVHLNSVKNLYEKQQLALELASKTATYNQTITVKDGTINQLQNEIIDISSQTDEVKEKVEELKKLEEEIRDVTGTEKTTDEASGGDISLNDQLGKSLSPVTIASAQYNKLERDALGVGGIQQEIQPHETDELLAYTKERLSTLEAQVDMLLTDIPVAKEELLAHMKMLRITPSIWPTTSTKTSSEFGYRKDPFTRRAAYHSGIDISGKTNDPVYATADGVVTHVGYDGGHGHNVIVKHSSGVSTRYSHLRKYLVKEGQKVEQGETIAKLGSSGRSTGPHLHYEVIKNGKSIDPAPYMGAPREEGN